MDGLKEAKEIVEQGWMDVSDVLVRTIQQALRDGGCEILGIQASGTAVFATSTGSPSFNARRNAICDIGRALADLGAAFQAYASVIELSQDGDKVEELDPVGVLASKLEL